MGDFGQWIGGGGLLEAQWDGLMFLERIVEEFVKSTWT